MQEIKQIVGGAQPGIATQSALDIKYSADFVEQEGEVPPFIPGQTDAERIRFVTEWSERKRKRELERERKLKEEQSGGVDVLYQRGPKK